MNLVVGVPILVCISFDTYVLTCYLILIHAELHLPHNTFCLYMHAYRYIYIHMYVYRNM